MASFNPDITNNQYSFKFISNQVDPIKLSMEVIDSDKNVTSEFPIETLLSELNINTNNLKNRFFWDIIKDANAGKNKINNIQTILQQCFPNSNPETGWQAGLHNLDTKIFDFVKNSGQIDDPYIDCKTSTEGQQNIKLSNADYVFYESGMGSDKLVHDNPIKIGSSAATLDPASKQEINSLFNYNLGFDSTFTSSLGFPPNITWVTEDLLTGTGSAPAPNTLCSSKVSINFGTLPNTDETMNISDTVQNKCGIIVTDSNQGNFHSLCLGNNEKNIKINENPDDLNNVKKFLIMKELGDIAQIWVYLAFVTILEKGGIPPLSPGPSKTARTDSVMLTTDNPVFLFCIMLKLACINSGSRQGVTSGGCKLKYYYPGEPQFKKKYENVQNIYYESTIQYNDNIKALILRIITNEKCKDVDIYILVSGKRGAADGQETVEPKCIPGAEKASIVQHARNEVEQKGQMVAQTVKNKAQQQNALVDFIIDYNNKISENNNTLKIISKFFEWNGIVTTDPLYEDAKNMSDMLKQMKFKIGFSNEVEDEWMQKLTILFDNNLNDKEIFYSLLNGNGVYNYICTNISGITNIIFNEDGILNPTVSNYESLKTYIQNTIDSINNLYHKITIGLKTEKCIMQHIKIKNDQSKTIRNIILPGNFFNSLKEIAFPDPSNKFKNFVRFAEVNDIIKGAMTNNINYDDQGQPIEDDPQFSVSSAPSVTDDSMSMGGGNGDSGEDPDGYQPYYTSLLLTYTDYQIKKQLNIPSTNWEGISFEEMIAKYPHLQQTEENLQLWFALKYEENTYIINFQSPGFDKLLVGKEQAEADKGVVMTEGEGRSMTEDEKAMLTQKAAQNMEAAKIKTELSLENLKTFTYVYGDTLIFNEGKRLAKYIAFADAKKLKEEVQLQMPIAEPLPSNIALNIKRNNTLKSRGINKLNKLTKKTNLKAYQTVGETITGGGRKTKKRLRRKLIKGKKSLKERKLLKQKKSLKVRKLNKLKKTIKNKSKS